MAWLTSGLKFGMFVGLVVAYNYPWQTLDVLQIGYKAIPVELQYFSVSWLQNRSPEDVLHWGRLIQSFVVACFGLVRSPNTLRLAG